DVPGLAELEPVLQSRHRAREIAPAEIEPPERRVLRGQAEGMIRGRGHPQPFLADGDALREVAELGQAEHQPHPRVHGRKERQPEALEGEVTDEPLDVAPAEAGAFAVAPELEVALSEIRVGG